MATILGTTAATVGFNTVFTQSITVTTDGIPDPSPTVTRSYVDPGVNVITATGLVTISGLYTNIIVTSWTYNDLSNNSVTITSVPAAGTFKMITKVDSPAKLKELCVYTINGVTFTHTVDLGSYSGIATSLTSLLNSVV